MSRYSPHCKSCTCHVPSLSNEVINRLCEVARFDIKQMKGRSRDQIIVRKRMFVAWVLRTVYRLSFPAIATIMNRDHSTIIFYLEQANNLSYTNSIMWRKQIRQFRSAMGKESVDDEPEVEIDTHGKAVSLGLMAYHKPRRERDLALIDWICGVVAPLYGLIRADLLQHGRYPLNVSHARTIAMVVAQDLGCGIYYIGEYFNYHHSTASHHYNRYVLRGVYKAEVSRIKELLAKERPPKMQSQAALAG